MHDDFCKILTATLHYFTEKHISYHKKMQHTGYLRHLLVRRAVKTGEILVALVTFRSDRRSWRDRGVYHAAVEAGASGGWLSCMQALQLDGNLCRDPSHPQRQSCRCGPER